MILSLVFMRCSRKQHIVTFDWLKSKWISIFIYFYCVTFCDTTFAKWHRLANDTRYQSNKENMLARSKWQHLISIISIEKLRRKSTIRYFLCAVNSFFSTSLLTIRCHLYWKSFACSATFYSHSKHKHITKYNEIFAVCLCF